MLAVSDPPTRQPPFLNRGSAEFVQVRFEYPEVLVAHDPAVALLGVQERSRRPAHRHGPVSPPCHAPCAAAHPRVDVVDHVGRAQAPPERRGQSDLADGEHLSEPFSQASRCVRMLLLHPERELLDPRLAVLRAQLPGGPQHGAGLVVEFLGQIAGHIAHLVVPAALHEARALEDLANRLAQRFGPVEDEQARPPGVQAALDEALEQLQRDDGALARALPEAQDPLVALVVHTERREDAWCPPNWMPST